MSNAQATLCIKFRVEKTLQFREFLEPFAKINPRNYFGKFLFAKLNPREMHTKILSKTLKLEVADPKSFLKCLI